jgi:hypothetical protein
MTGSDLRKHAQRILVMAAHLLICVPVFAQTYYSPQIREIETNRAYQKLLHASLFNFGGLGWGLEITSEQQAFKTLLESEDSIRLFQRLISEANAEGQLYALLGLRLRAPDIFQTEAEKLRTNGGPPERIEKFIPIEKGKIRVARGCISFHQDSETVIDEIAKGAWDAAALRSRSRIVTF